MGNGGATLKKRDLIVTRLYFLDMAVLILSVMFSIWMRNEFRVEALAKEKQDALAAKYGRIISLVPGKTERWLMLSFDDKISMYFGGKSDEPVAYIELSLFGGASDAVYDKLTAAICDAVSAETGIAPANIYVKYEEAEHWGWNGSNF